MLNAGDHGVMRRGMTMLRALSYSVRLRMLLQATGVFWRALRILFGIRLM